MRVETSDGIELHAEAHGEGIPILFSCAYSTTHENWRAQVEPLVAAGARVILWDYRGHGKSDGPHDPAAYTMDKLVDDLGRVLDWAVGDEPAVLCGLSFGGLTSLHFAARHLERVRALVLIAAGPGFKNPEAAAKWKQRTNRTADYIEAKGFEAFVNGKAGPTCIGRDPELPAQGGSDLHRAGPGAARRACRGGGDHRPGPGLGRLLRSAHRRAGAVGDRRAAGDRPSCARRRRRRRPGFPSGCGGDGGEAPSGDDEARRGGRPHSQHRGGGALQPTRRRLPTGALELRGQRERYRGEAVLAAVGARNLWDVGVFQTLAEALFERTG